MNKNAVDHLIEQRWILFFLITLWIILEYIGLGPFSYIRIHDTGDSHIPRYIILTANFFKNGITYWFPHMGCGVDRLSVDLLFPHFTTILFAILPGWVAYQIIIFILLFLGGYFTYRICKDYFQMSDIVSIYAGVVFALFLTDNISYQLGIAGFPFILWAIDRIIRQPNKTLYLWIIILGISYSLCSSLVKSLPFTLMMAFFWFIVIRRVRNLKFLIIFVIFCLVISIFQFNEIWSLFLNADLSHRAERGLYATAQGPIGMNTYFNIVGDSIIELLRNRSAFLLIFIGLLLSKFKSKLLIMLVSFSLFCSVGASIINISTLLFGEYLSFFRGFSFDRFSRLTPFFLALSAAWSLDLIRYKLKNWVIERKKSEKKLSWGVFNVFVVIIFTFLLYENCLTKIGHVSTWLYQGNYTHNYKSPELQRLSYRNKNELFRVASIYPGIHPAYANAYGLETVDGYMVLYPKSYHRFWSKVIEPLTDKEIDIYYYFNYWGNRVYLFCPKKVREIIFSNYYRLNLLSLANTKYIVSKIPIIDEDLKPILNQKTSWRELPKIKRALINIKANFKGIEYLYIYENKKCFPRFYLTKNIKKFKSSNDLLGDMSQAGFDTLRNTVYIEEKYMRNIELINRYESAQIEIVKYSPDRIEFSVELDGEGILIVSNNYSPYWKCKINDKETDIFPAYSTFWGVFLKKEIKKIIFYYDPPYSFFN